MHPNQTPTTPKPSPLYWGKENAGELEALLDEHPQVFLLSDTHCQKKVLPRLYALCPKSAEATRIGIPAGDIHKDYKSLIHIWDCLYKQQATRNSLLLCVGGGMVCDIGGFAASTWLRGIHFVLIPTTLMAQADAAIGGKNAINFKHAKNQAGLFNQPEATFLFPSLLETLPPRELLSGFAEMLKHGLIADAAYWHALQQCPSAGAILEHPDYIYRSACIKSEIVAKDFRDNGLRQKLNFGHTIGHALEAASHGTLTHGEAVAHGMRAAARISADNALLSEAEYAEIDTTITAWYGASPLSRYPSGLLMDYLRHDKKRKTEGFAFTLLDNIGHSKENQIVNEDEIARMLLSLQS